MLKRKNIAISVATLLCNILLAGVVNAASKCGDTDTYFEWKCQGDVPMMGAVVNIFKWLAAGMTVIVLIAIVYGAIIYATAGTDKQKVETGKKIIRNAIGALIAYFFMYALLNFVVPGGMFS